MSRSAFIQKYIDLAKANPRTIVLPEGADVRVREAAISIAAEKICKVIVLGDEELINSYFAEKGADTAFLTVINPAQSTKLEEYGAQFFEMRKAKGVTEEQALEAVKHVNYFGMMMMHNNEADGLVSGAAHSTADTIRPALQIIKGAKKGGMVSSAFFLVCNEKPIIFSDCALVIDPTADELAQIAVQSAQTAQKFDIPPCVAMLSYSTKGSGKGPSVDKVAEAAAKAKAIIAADYAGQGIKIDGELQLDSAVVPAIGKSKAPDSDVAGNASVLIFPDLNSANISYKAVQRLGGAEAIGPILQGLAKPVNDLSRGCSAEDILGLVALTVCQSVV
jgi:phosphate acetyltransferase